MDQQLMFGLTMASTGFCSLWTAVWLWWHARFQPVLSALAGFCLMMTLWSSGHLALLLDFRILGKALVLSNPLMPAFYLHFALQFVVTDHSHRGLQQQKKLSPMLFFLALIITLISWSNPSASVSSVGQLPQFFVFERWGWLNLATTVLLGIVAHWVLWQGFLQHQGNKRRSIAAIAMTAGLGLLLATSFVFPSFALNWFPYPMLLLPGYVLLLVYSVVRYQMLAVNAFASRALLVLAMGLLLLLLMGLISVIFGQLGMPALTAVPGWQLWLYSSVLLLLAAGSYRPVSRLAERLIYPGVQLSEQMVSQWLHDLQQAQDWPQLAQTASRLVSQPLKQPLLVEIYAEGELLATSAPKSESKSESRSEPILAPAAAPSQVAWQARVPQFVFRCRQQQQQWQFSLQGQAELPPGLRLLTEVFGSLLISSCANLQRALALATAEKQRLSQQHLVELGALAAAMAHELRNPLNIISMASAGVDAELRGHIQSQLKRADRLIADMLVYAGRLHLQFQVVDLHALLQSLTAQFDWQQVQFQLELPAGLQLSADPHRLQQVFINLLDNALAFVRNQPDGAILIRAQLTGPDLLIQVHNNGPALDASLTDSLFRPFVSKRAGGSGLGLAIVQRIIQAHHGHIDHRTDLGWPVSFEIRLPQHKGPFAPVATPTNHAQFAQDIDR
ncbi:MAG: ATP-binding protein [Rheinheimera sp.]